MIAGMRRHLSYANVISTVCLFVLLGGSAYAAAQITGKQVKNNSLTSADIRNRTLKAADFQPGLLPPAGSSQTGAVPIALSLPIEFDMRSIDVGSWTIGFTCTSREGRPQVQMWARTDEGAEGRLEFYGIRDDSMGGTFDTASGTVVNSDNRGVESRWAPAGGYASVGLDLQYRAGEKAGTVSVHMMADDRDGAHNCTVAGTAIPS
jgi:hypothetical protein